jgi:son of sevenless-like protein
MDLTFADEGNPNNLNDDPNLINFEKRILIYRIIQDLLINQQHYYTFGVSDPIYSFLAGLHHLPEKELYSISLYREPRGASLFEVLRGKHGGPSRSTM